jgi:hypothetical protein
MSRLLNLKVDGIPNDSGFIKESGITLTQESPKTGNPQFQRKGSDARTRNNIPIRQENRQLLSSFI